MMNNSEGKRIEALIPDEAKNLLIMGHIHPDGDCVGSCLGLYHYLRLTRPKLSLTVCLEPFKAAMKCLKDSEKIIMMDQMDHSLHFDCAISCDASDTKRLGTIVDLFEDADFRICIDHHVTNDGFGDINYVRGGLSSCSEALCELMDISLLDQAGAECLYLGMVHDSGVFKFSSTTRKTMEYAGMLMEKGIDTTMIIDETYYGKTLPQALLLGRGLSRMMLFDDNKINYVHVSLADMECCKATSMDTNGIVAEMRNITGIEVSIFTYEVKTDTYKFSLRSNGQVDVAKIAFAKGGGGHVKAAGFEAEGNLKELVEDVLGQIRAQL